MNFQEQFEMDDIQKALEYSMKETFKDLEKNLPEEPEGDKGILIHFIEMASGNLLSRRFLIENKIEVKIFF